MLLFQGRPPAQQSFWMSTRCLLQEIFKIDMTNAIFSRSPAPKNFMTIVLLGIPLRKKTKTRNDECYFSRIPVLTSL